MTFKAVSKTLLVAIAAGSFCISALAQWQWVDKDGRKVFSDRSPPAEIPEKNILKRPPGSMTPAPQTSPVAETPAIGASAPLPRPSASAPKVTGQDPQLEAKKKQAEAEEAARKKAEDDKVAKERAENCTRSRQALATLQSGIRVASVNAKGERIVMDDAARAAETKRVQDNVNGSCK